MDEENLEDKLIDKNIEKIEVLTTPKELRTEIPISNEMEKRVIDYRSEVENILSGKDDRLMIIVGPCSIHDKDVAKEYALKLKELSSQVDDKILLVMRTYFEKPRSTIGWTGLVYDPDDDGIGDIEKGIRMARDVCHEVTSIGLPCATEFVNLVVPQFYADFVSYAAIGARTSESQPHRHLASGLSMPAGIKNGTSGSIKVAVDGVVASNNKHTFLGTNEDGRIASIKTKGNKYSHVVLRGGNDGPNYSKEYVAETLRLQAESDLDIGIVIDASHANSSKDPYRQPLVVYDCVSQRKENKKIVGLMVESHLRGDLSKTDPCLPFPETEEMILKVYKML